MGLTVNGVAYHGEGNNYGPSGVAMSTGDQMEWRSDGSVKKDGFKVCANAATTSCDIGDVGDGTGCGTTCAHVGLDGHLTIPEGETSIGDGAFGASRWSGSWTE